MRGGACLRGEPNALPGRCGGGEPVRGSSGRVSWSCNQVVPAPGASWRLRSAAFVRPHGCQSSAICRDLALRGSPLPIPWGPGRLSPTPSRVCLHPLSSPRLSVWKWSGLAADVRPRRRGAHWALSLREVADAGDPTHYTSSFAFGR